MTSEIGGRRAHIATAVLWLMSVAVSFTICAGAAAQSTPQPSGSREKPNIAISGCLLRQGYATLVVGDAHIDGVGEAADRAQPGAADNGLKDVKVPVRWILDDAGAITQHVGEKVQVVGRTEWVAGKGRPGDDDAVPPAVPHVSVASVRVIAASCS